VTRAVVFDLWDTLVDFDPVAGRAFQDQVAVRLGRDPDEFAALWFEGRAKRESGTLREYLLELGAPEDLVDELVNLRRDLTRRLLAPRPGAVETLGELRAQGRRVGLITVCSEDVPDVWGETPFVDLFDAAVFSCSVGIRKPDRSTAWRAKSLASSPTRRCSSATAPTTSSPERSGSECARS
jgi:putative hydrolase of the HAD superfamily